MAGADPRGFAVVLFIALAVICAWLRVNNFLSGPAFAASLVASAVAAALIMNVDRLDKLSFGRGDSAMRAEFQRLQDEVYAKVEELRRVARGVAVFTAS